MVSKVDRRNQEERITIATGTSYLELVKQSTATDRRARRLRKKLRISAPAEYAVSTDPVVDPIDGAIEALLQGQRLAPIRKNLFPLEEQ